MLLFMAFSLALLCNLRNEEYQIYQCPYFLTFLNALKCTRFGPLLDGTLF
jgi:hypothetical protein